MKILLSLFLLFASSFATAASNSNPGLYYGQVPTAAQWNSYFSSKLDYVPGAANTIPYWDGSGTIINALVGGDCTSVANVFTCTATGATGLTVQVSNNANYYPLFAASTTNSSQPFNLGTGLSFNPSTNTLTTTNFVGSLTGTASGNVVIGGALGTPSSGTLTNVTGLPLSGLTTQASNTVVGNATASSASPTALTMPTCFGSTSALLWTPNSGYSCNSSISANTSTNISGGTQYGVLYQSASGTTASTAAGTPGYVLTSNGTSAPTFQSTSATVYDPTNVAITGGTIGGITSFASQSPTVNDLGAPHAWSSSYSLFGPNANTTTQSALGLGYDNTNQVGYILSLTPGTIWNELTLDGSIINFDAAGLPAASVSSTTFNSVNAYSLNGKILFSSTAPTIWSGFGTSPSVTFNNGTAAFSVNVGTGGTASAGTINMNVAAPNYWSCAVTIDNGDLATGMQTILGSMGNQILTFKNVTISTGAVTPWTTNDVFFVNCVAM